MKYTSLKQLLWVWALLACMPMAYAQSDVITTHFSDYMEKEDYRTVYITKRMFRLVAQVAEGSEDAALEEAVKNLDGLRSLSADKDGLLLYQTFAKRIPKGFEELLSVQEGKERTCFWVKENAAGKVSELLMLKGSKEEILLVSIYGIVDLKQIAKLSRRMDIDGLDKLGEVED